ncbi:Extracellular serine-threonine rich protein [Penicillium digitatum]|nr:Extracellular serine-threonine rich protein [Penicillium digitatum]
MSWHLVKTHAQLKRHSLILASFLKLTGFDTFWPIMKGIALISLFSAALAHPAGLWWGTDVCYTSPDNTDNQCSDAQQKGFDLSELGNGDNWSLEGFHFVGLEPKNGCQGSSYGGTCLGGKLSSDDDWTIKISATDAPFSIRNFHLSTSRSTDIFIIYEMPDGSSCRHVASSSYRGTDIGNDQCGGAISVEFTLPQESKFGDCDLEIHSIDFDCSTGSKPPAPPVLDPSHSYLEPTPSSTVSLPPFHLPSTTPKPPTVSHSSHKMTTSTVWTTEEYTITKCPPTVTNCPGHSTVLVTSTYPLSTTVCPSTPVEPETSKTSSWVAHSDPPSVTASLHSFHLPSTTPDAPPTIHSSQQMTTSTIWTTEEFTITNCPPTVTNCPAHSTVFVTSTYPLSTTVCPSRPAETGPSTTSTRDLNSHPPLTSAISNTIATEPSPPTVTAPCPNVVPKCLNTWLSIPKCDSNSDTACFCPSTEFTDKVSGCIRAWSSSQKEEDSALAFFAGICAPFVPQNPAIVDIATTCTSSAPVSWTTHVPQSPSNTHPFVETVAVATSVPQAPCTTISWASHTATVPLVEFSTVTCATTTSVNLVPVTTASPPSQTSPHAHASSSTLKTSYQTHSTSVLTPTAPKTSVSEPTVSKPTETVVLANGGSKLSLCSIWTFAISLLVLLF